MQINYEKLYEACGHDMSSGLFLLEDMTEEEVRELFTIVFPQKTLHPNMDYDDVEKIWKATTKIPFGQTVAIQLEYGGSKQFLYLLSKGFDLFDLIDRNLAIRKEKV